MSGFAMVALLAVFIGIGLLAYERYGLRLGGVLVLPLLLLYAVADAMVIPLFLAAAAVTYLIGEVIHRLTLLYGRRLFVVYLIASLAVTYFMSTAIGGIGHGHLFPLLPGLFAFNLHREGRPIRGAIAFVGWMGLFAMVGVVVLSFVQGTPAFADPLPVPFPGEPVPTELGDAFCGTLTTVNGAIGDTAECVAAE